jgi:3',5'-cyclic-AMP phosphodiesterase
LNADASDESAPASRVRAPPIMESHMGKYIDRDDQHDGVDRRGFLKCMAWAGTGIAWTASGGLLSSNAISAVGRDALSGQTATFSFVQISDSHIGFAKEANKDVVSTLGEAVRRINALPVRPDFVIHTGDLTHLSKPAEFDTLDQVLKGMKTGRVFFVPGEHDVLDDNGSQFLERHGKGTQGQGWYSFDHRGVHFIGLVNVVNLQAGGLGLLGGEQLQWLDRDVKRLPASTPIVVFAHIPLWAVYPQWGWGTDDSAQALSYLKRFGSVTVLNGHIHQVLQKVEGKVRFHTAMSTAFPQPAPGAGPGPGPMKVPAEELRRLLGLTDVDYVERGHALAVVDESLG